MFAASKTSAAVAAPLAGDPYFSSVSLLLHGDGTNGAQNNTFIDSSTNNFTVTRNGTPTQGSFSPFPLTAVYDPSVNGGSGIFNGTTDYVTVNPQGFNASVGDWTIEMWCYFNTTTGNEYVLVGDVAGVDRFYMVFLGSTFYLGDTATNPITVSSARLSNQWFHLAVVRNGATMTAYKNGVSFGSTVSSLGNYTLDTFLIGARFGSPPGKVNGYISNLRIVKGTAVYTANFTPPTAPLTAITNTSLLLNFINAGIYDNAAKNNLVTVGNAQVSTAVKKYGTGSMAFDGAGDWLTSTDSPNGQLGSGNFTIEGWAYLSATGVVYGLVSKGTSTTGFSFGVNASNQLVFNYTTSALTASTALSATTWYYVTVVRNGTATGNVKIYLNGNVDATSSGAITDNFNQTNMLYIGADRTGANAMNGYIDDLRITKGVARYTANFTPPTAALPDF